MKKQAALMLLLGGFTGWAQAGGSVDLGLSDKSVRLEHEAAYAGTGAYITAGGLYNEENGYAVSVGFNAVNISRPESDLLGGLGMKLYVYDSEEAAISAAVGGFIRYSPDALKGFGVEGMAYYSPDVISFNETRGFYELSARLTYRIIPQARVFIGYQDVTADYEDGGLQPVDRTFMAGFRLSY